MDRVLRGSFVFVILGAAWAVGTLPQEPEFVEIRFVRIHLKNGNFLEGDVALETRHSVTLRTKQGELVLDRGAIERLEQVRLRTAVVKPAPKPCSPPPAPGAPTETPNPLIDRILEQLLTAREEQAFQLLQNLIQAGRPAVGYLVRKLGTVDARLRPSVAAALVELRDPRAVPGLVALLGQPNPALRAEAVRILGLLGDPAAADALAQALQDEAALVRSAAVEALGALDTRDAFRALAPLCADPEREVRLRALQVLPALAQNQDRWNDLENVLLDALDVTRGDARADVIAVFGLCRFRHAARYLIPCLRDEAPAVRGAAADALCALEAWDSADRILERLLEERDSTVRIRLAAAAARFKLQASIGPLISWLGDADPRVAQAALGALRPLTGQDFGEDAARWAAWWATVRPKG